MNFENIDKIYILYINEKELVQAKKYIYLNKLFNKKIRFFKGCLGREFFKDIPPELNKDIIQRRTNFLNRYLPKMNFKDKCRNLNLIKLFLNRDNKGEWGCSQSHINILEDALKNKYEKIIVLEYDFFISNDFKNKINEFNNIDKTNFKCISLGSTQYKLNHQYNDYPNLFKFDNYFSTFAIYLNNIDGFFKEFINTLKTFIIPADHCLDIISLYYNREGFALFYPYLFICNITKSGTSDLTFKMKTEAEKRNWNVNNYNIKLIFNNNYLSKNKIIQYEKFGKYNINKTKYNTIYQNIIPIFKH